MLDILVILYAVGLAAYPLVNIPFLFFEERGNRKLQFLLTGFSLSYAHFALSLRYSFVLAADVLKIGVPLCAFHYLLCFYLGVQWHKANGKAAGIVLCCALMLIWLFYAARIAGANRW